MDSSFLKTQHPVVEELLTNKYFGDTLLVCANGHLTDNKLAVGLLFPSLLTSDIFGLPIENVLLVPDYTMEEIGREFEKLLLQTFPQGPPAVASASAAAAVHQQTSVAPLLEEEEEVQELVIDETAEEGCQPSTSYSVGPPQNKECPTIDLSHEILDPTMKANAGNNFGAAAAALEPMNVNMDAVEAVDVQNGFELNCHHIEIGQVADTDGSSIQIYVQQENAIEEDVNQNCEFEVEDEGGGEGWHEEVEILEQGIERQGNRENNDDDDDEGPPDLTYFPYVGPGSCPFVDETVSNSTDGEIPILRPAEEKHGKSKKTVTFSPDVAERPAKRLRPLRARQPRLRLKVVEGSQEEIQNLPGLPEPEPQAESPRRSPKKESPILENRKPGRPRTRPDLPGLLRKPDNNGLTRFKQKSAEWKAAEVFKCGVCNKVLSCRGSFERHSRMHRDSKPFKCAFCPKSFGEACKKAIHERVHSGSKPFPCLQCSKSFRTATQRNVHRRSHTKERPFKCEICNKVFSQAYSVKVHKEKFHKT